jgi:superoxide dismutase
VLLSWSARHRKLVNQWAPDHCHTLAGGAPILALDMHQHSYHINFGAKGCRQRRHLHGGDQLARGATLL